MITGSRTVSMVVEVPEELHEGMRSYLESHPDWDQERAIAAALSLFLIQNSSADTPEASRTYRRAARFYLDSLFKAAV